MRTLPRSPAPPRLSVALSLLLVLPGCAILDRIAAVPDSNPDPGVVDPPSATAIAPPPIATTGLPGAAGAQTAESLDQTTEAERAAAVAAPSGGAERELGRTVVALGDVAEQGFWLKSNLVTAPAKGRVATGAGASVNVDLLPSEGGATLSLAAYRALGLALTDLPEITVFATN
jgi:hypothetical protein